MAIKLVVLGLLVSAASSLGRGGGGGGGGYSFQHFRGPVQGEDKEVAWVDKDGKRHQDYAAPAQYEFAYGVEDHHTGDYHGQKEQRDGKTVAGEYTVREPNGNIRTVKYTADEGGFRATVHNSQGGGGGGGGGAGPESPGGHDATISNDADDDDDGR